MVSLTSLCLHSDTRVLIARTRARGRVITLLKPRVSLTSCPLPHLLSHSDHALSIRLFLSGLDPTFFPGRAATIHLRPAASGAPEKMLSDDGPSGQPALDAAATSKESESASLPAPGSQSEPASGLASASSPLNSVKDTLGKALSDVLSSTRGAAHKSRTLAGQSCDVEIGALGVLHPQVLKAFDIDFPCSALEFDLEPFL